jgi:hypothetical protein
MAACEEASHFVAGNILYQHSGDDWDLYDEYQAFADSGYATVGEYWTARHLPEQ